jgi:hypothetical protein
MGVLKLDNPFEETLPLPGKAAEIQVVMSRRRKPAPKLESSPFDDLPSEHDVVKKYKPKFLGKGGENLVYEAEGHKDVVIKAMKQPLAEQLAFNTKQGLETGDESLYVDELREGRLKRERERFQKLREAFGEHVLPQKFFVVEVPVGQKVLEELIVVAGYSGADLPKKAESGWTIASVQKRAHVLEDARRLSLTGGNVEPVLIKSGRYHDPITRDVYRHVTDNLMSPEIAEKSSVYEEDIRQLMGGSGFANLIKIAVRDEGLADALRDFQKRAVLFSEKNDDILDIAGKDNIVFHRDQDGAWTYTIIDGLYPFDTKVLSKGREALIKMDIGIRADSKEQNTFMQSVNYVRVVNGLGKVLETGRYIDFLPEELKNTPEVVSNHILGKDQPAEAA